MAEETASTHDPRELIRHIETRFHARHREQLPKLVALAAKVEQVHASVPDAPMIGELEVHMKKEELILFTAMRRNGGAGLATTIAIMRADHDDHTAEISRIRDLTNDLRLPDGACRKWTVLYEGLSEFVSDLDAHVRLENDVLFPSSKP